MARTRKTALRVARETTGYGLDPDTTGAVYEHVPVLGVVGRIKDTMAMLATDYATGRNFPTAPEPGADGWSIEFETPVLGLNAAAGDGVTPGAGTIDWYDILLQHLLSASTTVIGEGVGIGSTTTSLVLDTDPAGYDIQLLVPTFEAALPTAAAARTQWTLLTISTNPYTIAPSFVTAPTTAAVSFGTRTHLPSDAGGTSLAFVYTQDDLEYTLLGGRCTGSSILGEVGQFAKHKFAFSGDSIALTTKASLVAIATPSRTPIKTLLSPLWFNAVQYATRRLELDFGITAAVQESTQATQGRAEYESIHLDPTIKFEPLYTDALKQLKRTPTRGRVLLQFGAGVLSGGVLNTCAVHAEQGAITMADATDDAGRVRQEMSIAITDAGLFTGSTVARFFQFVRA